MLYALVVGWELDLLSEPLLRPRCVSLQYCLSTLGVAKFRHDEQCHGGILEPVHMTKEGKTMEGKGKRYMTDNEESSHAGGGLHQG